MTSKKIDYQKLSAELDQLIGRLGDSDQDIDTALKEYQRGVAIVKELEIYLKTAENTVTDARGGDGAD